MFTCDVSIYIILNEKRDDVMTTQTSLENLVQKRFLVERLLHQTIAKATIISCGFYWVHCRVKYLSLPRVPLMLL